MPQPHLRPLFLPGPRRQPGAQSYKTTINQAFEYLKAAKYPEGLALAQRAVAIAERGGATQKDLAYALIMLGNFYSIQGRYADAEPIYKRALAISEKVSGAKSSEYANVLSNLGTFYNNQGRYDEAEALWKRSLAIDEVAWAAMPHVFTSQLENLGKLYVKLGRYAEAEQTLKRTVAIWQAGYGAETPLASRSMGELGNLYRVQGRYAEAEPLLKKAVDLWEKNFSIKPDFAEMMSDLARLYQAQRRFAEAEQYYNRALTTHEKLFGSPNPQIAATHQAIAGMFAAAGEPQKALASSRKAVAMTIAYADSEGQSGARVATTNSAIGLSASYFDDHVSLLAAADRAGIEPHDALAREGFRIAQWTSQSSAASAVQQMAVRSIAGSGTLGELVRKSQDLGIAWKEKERALVSVAGNGLSPQTQVQLATLRKQMAEIERSRAAIAARLSAEFPQYVSLASPRPASVEEVQALLGPNEAILFLLPGAREVHGFALTRDRFEWRTIDLNEKNFVERITAFRQGLDINQLDRARHAPAKAKLFDLSLAHGLYTTMLGPFEEQIRDKRDLLIVPSGPLTALPFHLLVTDLAGPPKGQAGSDPFAPYRNASWLLKRHAIAVLPAISSLKALRSLSRSGAAPKAIVGFGDPVFGPEKPLEDSGPKVAMLTRAYAEYWQGAGVDRKVLSQSLARLPGTADELKNVTLKLGGSLDDIYLRERATETNAKSLPLTDYRIVYFATHGLVAGDIAGRRRTLVGIDLADRRERARRWTAHGERGRPTQAQRRLGRAFRLQHHCRRQARCGSAFRTRARFLLCRSPRAAGVALGDGYGRGDASDHTDLRCPAEEPGRRPRRSPASGHAGRDERYVRAAQRLPGVLGAAGAGRCRRCAIKAQGYASGRRDKALCDLLPSSHPPTRPAPDLAAAVEKQIRPRFLAGKQRRRQFAAKTGAGIEVEAVLAQVRQRCWQRRVAMHHEPAVIVDRRQERFAYPQQVALGLVLERNSGTNSGMHEQPAAIDKMQRQRLEPGKMRGRKPGLVIDPIALQCRLAAIGPPVEDVADRAIGMRGIEQHRLVIAEQANEAVAVALLRDQEVQHLLRIRSAVDIVADQDKAGAPAARDFLADAKQRAQLVEAAVNVADCKGERGGHASLHGTEVLRMPCRRCAGQRNLCWQGVAIAWPASVPCLAPRASPA